MRAVLALLLLTPLVLLPSALAHDCAGSYCGPCTQGESHHHADSMGSCSSRAGPVRSGSSGGVGAGASVGEDGVGVRANANVPGLGLVGALVGLAGAALVLRRR